MPSRAASRFCAAKAAISRRRRRPIPAFGACRPTAMQHRARAALAGPQARRCRSTTARRRRPARRAAQRRRPGDRLVQAARRRRSRRPGRRPQGGRRGPLRPMPARGRQLPQPAARPHRRLEHPARRAQDRGRLRRRPGASCARSPTGPSPRCCAARPRSASAPRRRPATSFRYFTAFPPLTSTGHMRRLEAAQRGEPERRRQVRARQLAERHLPQLRTRTISSTATAIS